MWNGCQENRRGVQKLMDRLPRFVKPPSARMPISVIY
jgi:hypothetical protein